MSDSDINWTPDLAYAVGLITTDGYLSIDGRHINLTSKDLDQINNLKQILQIKNKISLKKSGFSEKRYYQIQFGNIKLYKWLLSIGLTHNKSKTLGPLNIPREFFVDFLRGCLDGDGNISIAKHPESQYPQLRLRFASASTTFLNWLKGCINEHLNTRGGFVTFIRGNTYYLVFAKADSIKILDLIYYDGVQYYLQRKFDYYKKMGEWWNWQTRCV